MWDEGNGEKCGFCIYYTSPFGGCIAWRLLFSLGSFFSEEYILSSIKSFIFSCDVMRSGILHGPHGKSGLRWFEIQRKVSRTLLMRSVVAAIR
jgi:hypothetical protein